MAEFDIESIIKSGVEKALNNPAYGGKTILEWAAIGIKNGGCWISVKAKLPDNSGLYLTWCKPPSNNRGFYRLSDYKLGNGWYDWVHHDYSDRYVVFWMLLPEPPKEEEEG